mmetsp:Transcript_4526/g.12159  ORF Transcript_4526/g.12159 Transcript_4526/m.12159 type:complete len:325 (-) Transcript_4526:52-1026(-)
MLDDVHVRHGPLRQPVRVPVVLKLQKKVPVLAPELPRALHHNRAVERRRHGVHRQNRGAREEVLALAAQSAPRHGDDQVLRYVVHLPAAVVALLVGVHHLVRTLLRLVRHHHRNDPFLRPRIARHFADVRGDAFTRLRRQRHLLLVRLLLRRLRRHGRCVPVCAEVKVVAGHECHGHRVERAPRGGCVGVDGEFIFEPRLVSFLHLLRERVELLVQGADVELDHLHGYVRQPHLLRGQLDDVHVVLLDLVPRLARRVDVVGARLPRRRAGHGEAFVDPILRLLLQGHQALVDVLDRVHHALELDREGGGDFDVFLQKCERVHRG